MERKNENATQLFAKVCEYFPKQARNCLDYKTEYGADGNVTAIVIRGRFPKALPQYDAKLLEIISGQVTEQQQDSVVIRGKWQGIECRLQLRGETLAAATV